MNRTELHLGDTIQRGQRRTEEIPERENDNDDRYVSSDEILLLQVDILSAINLTHHDIQTAQN